MSTPVTTRGVTATAVTPTHRGRYVAALVAAVLTLVLTLAAAALVPTQRPDRDDPAALGPRGHPAGMMGSGGMMSGWDDDGTSVTPAQASAIARTWIGAHEPGATLGQRVRMPLGYVFTVTRDSELIGTVVVPDDTGAVVWMGVSQASPGPS